VGIGGKEGNTVVISEESLGEWEGDACTDVVDSEEEEWDTPHFSLGDAILY